MHEIGLCEAIMDAVERRACGHVTEANDLPVACPRCGAVELDSAGGDELLSESIGLAVPAAGAS
jgi:Zn finger protein HypA/HybF involved in hydrogenase expression